MNNAQKTLARGTVAALFAAVAVISSSSRADEAHGVGFKIVNNMKDSSGAEYCMDASLDAGAQSTNWERVYVFKCHGRENQRFTLTDNSDGVNAAIVGHAGKCLDVSHWGTADDTKLQLWRCHFGDNQRFTFNPSTGQIADAHSGKCLSIAAAGNRKGITLEDCDGRSGESWHLAR